MLTYDDFLCFFFQAQGDDEDSVPEVAGVTMDGPPFMNEFFDQVGHLQMNLSIALELYTTVIFESVLPLPFTFKKMQEV